MLVSGLTIERKKISEQKHGLKSKSKKPSRPYSSQLPQINQYMRRSTKNIDLNRFNSKKDEILNIFQQDKQQKKPQNINKDRHLSTTKTSGKIVSRKNLSSLNKQFISNNNNNTVNDNKSIKSSLKQIREFNSVNGNYNNTNTMTKKPFSIQQQKRQPLTTTTTTKKRLQLLNSKSPSGHQQVITRNGSINLALFDEIEKQKLTKYFRYYPLVVIQSCMKRQQFMLTLLQAGDVQVYNKNKLQKVNNNINNNTRKKPTTAIDISQPWTKLIKLANLKGKYKYREKFNFNNSAQLKAIKFKRKEIKKKKQSQSSSSDQEEKKQKCRDMDTWKKAMGVQGAKVFIIKGKYTDFKNSLLERGWVENPDKHSSFFDLKWTTKVSDLTFESLKHNQIVNHFNNNACLTSKYGICKSLRSVMYSEQIDVDRFFPKAFDLTDSSDFENFLQMYKWVYCESILKEFNNSFNNNKNLMSKLKPQTIKLAYIVTSRRLTRIQTILKHTLQQRYFLPSIQQWLAIFNDEFIGGKDSTATTATTFDQFYDTFQAWDLIGDKQDTLRQKVEKLLTKLRQHQPQYDINGNKNIWIVKPAFLSRGRGIKCMNKFYDILNYSLGKQTQYVVQKYIQNPLIINKKKFDIRQWVLVEDYNPPKIWIYGEFYCRFCLQEYDELKITNKFAHLTNNSVQKYNKNLTQAELKESLKNSMWTQEQLKDFIESSYQKESFKIVQQKIREIVIATILSTADQVHGRKNSFQLIGYDFMIDDLLNPWLIEINTSPAMDYSTPVTQRLVKMVLEDVAKVVVDLKSKKSKKKTAGLFKCIYNGQERFVSKHYNLLKKYPTDQIKPQQQKIEQKPFKESNQLPQQLQQYQQQYEQQQQ